MEAHAAKRRLREAAESRHAVGMRLILLLAIAPIVACDVGAQCAPDCRPDQVVVDAAVPDGLSALPQNGELCRSLCPSGSKYGWSCSSVDGGVLCDPICPC